jgi:carboxyl-terminal processing protease
MNKRSAFLPLVIAFSLIAGILLSGLIWKHSANMAMLNQSKKSKLNALLDFVTENYVDTVNQDEIIELAIPKFLEELDPHSVYISADDLAEMNEPLEGSFEGIGIQYNMRHDTLQVLHVFSGGPSEKAGLKNGDQIISVNDSIIAGIDIDTRDVMKMLKGPKGTKVKVGVLRKENDSLIYFTIIRDKIPIHSVDISYMVSKNIGHIKISSFSNTTYQEFSDAILDLKAQGMKKIILDLRSNTGGIMDAATKIADDFLEADQMIVYTQGRKHGKIEVFSTKSKNLCIDLDLVILIDEFSASASEILAGAIQDNDRGWIIGRRSFGKGLVQEPVSFDDGSGLRLTIARYYTPAGRCIQKSYNSNLDDYYSDLYLRYTNGEMISKDSIVFNDSLKYFTRNGRTVYGGGGIMPDIFVPIDTSEMNSFYYKVQNSNAVYEFAFSYTQQNRNKLNQYTQVSDLENYLIKSHTFDRFLEYLQTQGISFSDTDLALVKPILEVQVYASISRNILHDSGFYPIIHRIDDSFLKAFEVLDTNHQLLDSSQQ